MRHFLPRDVADGLQVPKANYTRFIIRLMELFSGWALSERRVRAALRRFDLELIQALLDFERGVKRPPFAIPAHLADGWKE
jgi:hypothetical protein